MPVGSMKNPAPFVKFIKTKAVKNYMFRKIKVFTVILTNTAGILRGHSGAIAGS